MKQLLSATLAAIIFVTACDKNKNDTRYYEVNSATSVAGWKGSAPDHFHVGDFMVKGSLTTTAAGKINGGNFTIPIASIRNFDLPDAIKPQLLGHLQTADFFNMALYPDAGFVIKQTSSYSGKFPGAIANANTIVTGDFTLIGQTHSITFPAYIDFTGDSLKIESTLTFDRTKWGMNSYSDPKAESYILPGVDIHLEIQAAKRN